MTLDPAAVVPLEQLSMQALPQAAASLAVAEISNAGEGAAAAAAAASAAAAAAREDGDESNGSSASAAAAAAAAAARRRRAALSIVIGLSNGVLLRTEVDRSTGALLDTRTRFLGPRPVALTSIPAPFDARTEGSGAGAGGKRELPPLLHRALRK